MDLVTAFYSKIVRCIEAGLFSNKMQVVLKNLLAKLVKVEISILE